MTTVPVDILLKKDGIIEKVYYGSNTTDHLKFDDIKTFSLSQLIQLKYDPRERVLVSAIRSHITPKIKELLILTPQVKTAIGSTIEIPWRKAYYISQSNQGLAAINASKSKITKNWMFDPRRTLFLIIKYTYETNYILPAPGLVLYFNNQSLMQCCQFF